MRGVLSRLKYGGWNSRISVNRFWKQTCAVSSVKNPMFDSMKSSNSLMTRGMSFIPKSRNKAAINRTEIFDFDGDDDSTLRRGRKRKELKDFKSKVDREFVEPKRLNAVEKKRNRLDFIRGNRLVLESDTSITVATFANRIHATIDDVYETAAHVGLTIHEPPVDPMKDALRSAKDGDSEGHSTLVGSRRKEELHRNMARRNAELSSEDAELLAAELGVIVDRIQPKVVDLVRAPAPPPEIYSTFPLRPPIVTVMGHVDHGKTTLLDSLRHAHVAQGEAGGITQAIGAFKVNLGSELDESGAASTTANTELQQVTFLDTPGHEAFTAMRMHGANCTDIVVLVVSCDDGVQPQTLEAISHARAAGASIVVALNKIDVDGANPERTMNELVSAQVIVEQRGGEIPCVPISAKRKTNLKELIEIILLQAEILDLRADPTARAEALVIEARLSPKLGVVANAVLRCGTLRVGDIVVAGNAYGRVRALHDEMGNSLEEVTPSTPFSLLGLKDVPDAGVDLIQAENEKHAHAVVELRKSQVKRELAKQDGEVAAQNAAKSKKRRLNLLSQISAQQKRRGEATKLLEADKRREEQENAEPNEIIPLNLILKADVHGSVSALEHAIASALDEMEDVNVKIQHIGVGGVNRSDLMLAAASDSIIVAFPSDMKRNSKVQVNSQRKGDGQLVASMAPFLGAVMTRDVSVEAEKLGVTVYAHNIIYKLIDALKERIELLKTGGIEILVEGMAEIREIFDLSGKEKGIQVAGCRVDSGVIKKSLPCRVWRDSEIIYTGEIASLRQFRDQVNEVKKGMECGITLTDFKDQFQKGDRIEVYREKTIQ